MNPGQKPEHKTHPSKSKIYFVLGSVSLTLMALVWSLDDSLVYIFAGAAAYLLFLSFWHRPKKIEYAHRKSSHYQGESYHTPNIFQELINVLKKKKSSTQYAKGTGHPQSPRVIGIIFGIGFFLFFVFVFVIITFSEESESSVDAFTTFELGEQFRLSGQYDSADVYYNKVLNEQPDHAGALNGRARVFLAYDNYDSALAYANRSLDSDPELEDAHYTKGLVYYYTREYDKTKQEAFQIMRINPDYYDATLLAGDSYYAKSNYDSAIRWYEEGYEKGLRSLELCHIMAYIYDTKGKNDRAIELYQEALNYDSTKVEIYTRLSELVSGEDGNWYRQAAQRLKAQGY